MLDIIDIGEDRYEVLRRINDTDGEIIDKIKSAYRELYADSLLIKSVENPAIDEHYLICRKIEDVEIIPD